MRWSRSKKVVGDCWLHLRLIIDGQTYLMGSREVEWVELDWPRWIVLCANFPITVEGDAHMFVGVSRRSGDAPRLSPVPHGAEYVRPGDSVTARMNLHLQSIDGGPP